MIDVKTHLSIKNTTEQVSGGFITLKGFLVRGRYDHGYEKLVNFTVINEIGETVKLRGFCHPNYNINPDAVLWYLPVRYSVYLSLGEELQGLILDNLEGDNNFNRVGY
jgi:hypothetical protein